MPSNMPPGYSEDGDAPEHMRETALFQELQEIREKFSKWRRDYVNYIPTIEADKKAEDAENALFFLSEELDHPL